MFMRRGRSVCLAFLVLGGSAQAQGTNGAIQGRITDNGGLPLRDTRVDVTGDATGLRRSTVTDDSGSFRLAGLPVGTYDVRAETLPSPHVASGVPVNVAATTTVNFSIPLAVQQEALTITSAPLLIDARESGVAEVVTQAQVDGLPLNGRQYANLAALVPGVRLGFLFNYGKGTQFAPVVLGGTGRNVSYVVDGGDQNDDKRGGVTQLFPIDAVEEFNFQQRFKAEYGRATGAVLNVVTKAGANELRGSAFFYVRDDALSARTTREKKLGLAKPDFRRYQFGGTLGGPIVKDRAHFLVSLERIDQQASATVTNGGLYPAGEGTFDLPLHETALLGRLTVNVGDSSYLSLRYAFDHNRYRFTWPESRNDPGLRGTPNRPPESWSDVRNRYHSMNAAFTSVLRPGLLNELVGQFSSTSNPFADRTDAPVETFPSGFYKGRADLEIVNRQQRFQVRDDLTWRLGSHEMKLGIVAARDPVLRSPRFGEATRYHHLRDNLASPIDNASTLHYWFLPASVGLPNNQYAIYVQDTKRAGDRLTLDLGLRYELVTGLAIDQQENPLFRELQAAGTRGTLEGVRGLEDFGKSRRDDRDNLAPRVGLIWDAKGDGRTVLRAGAGRYYDFCYADAAVGLALWATIESVSDPAGIRGDDGAFLRPGDALPSNASTTITPFAIAVSPRLRQPFTDQLNLGFAAQLGDHWAVEVDALYSKGHDWAVRFNPNVLAGGQRRLAGVLPTLGGEPWSVISSGATDEYRGVSLAVKRAWTGKLQLLASYTLATVDSMSPGGVDDYRLYQPLSGLDPFASAQQAPAGTDARHSVNLSGLWSPGRGWTLGSVLRWRSRTRYTVITGTDDNSDGANFDLPPGSRGPNQAWGASFSQLDLRLVKRLPAGERASLEIVLDAFNVLDAENPSDYDGNMRRASFGLPLSWAGDGSGVGEPRGGEQRQVRFGARVRF